ncbi:SDH family Clp fold serine proteinase [Humibacter antri]
MIDQIFPENLTYLEELLTDCEPDRPLHVVIASPGGDGETAIRMVRAMQARCTELVMIVPDMAKSAATLICLGADRIVMGPSGDLGPVDPQFQLGNGRGLGSAKEIVAAIDEAESRIKQSPETFPLFASLLSDVNMLMVEQARSALTRTGAMVSEALAAAGRDEQEVATLTEKLRAPLIDDPASHSAVISAEAAHSFGLPAESVDHRSDEWNVVWQLWTRYFLLGCFPVGRTAVYEGKRASHIMNPGQVAA